MILLKISSWQFILLFLIPLFISANITSDWISICLNLFASILIFSWYLFTGKCLNEQLSDDEKESDVFFIINCFYLMVFTSVSSVLNSGQRGDETEMPLVLLVMAIYFVIAFLYVVYFASKSFLSVQEIRSRRSTHYSYQTVFLFFLIFVVGIWFIQPKMNEYFSEKG